MKKWWLLFLSLWLLWQPARVAAVGSDDYDPFLGGFIAAPPEKMRVRAGLTFTVSAQALPGHAWQANPTLQYMWRWQGQTLPPARKVNLSASNPGLYPLELTVQQGSQALYHRAFSVEVVKNLPAETKVVDPESLFAFPGFPLMVQFQSGLNFGMDRQYLDAIKGFFTDTDGIFFASVQPILWNTQKPTAPMMDFDWRRFACDSDWVKCHPGRAWRPHPCARDHGDLSVVEQCGRWQR